MLEDVAHGIQAVIDHVIIDEGTRLSASMMIRDSCRAESVAKKLIKGTRHHNTVGIYLR